MKKNQFFLVTLLAVAVLAGCSAKKSETPASSSSSETTSQTASTQTEPSDTTASSSTASSEEPAASEDFVSMDIEAVSQGDYSSIIGTWKNSRGDTLVFNDLGLVSDGGASLSSYSEIADGILEVGVVATQGTGGYVLVMVPKGVTIPDTYFENGSDTTNRNRDRMVGTQQKFYSSETLDLDMFYRVKPTSANGQDPLTNNNTGVTLDSGQVTIDYANSILGNRNWAAIESNYNRTESIPFELLQGDNGSLYRVYRNGVITSETKNIIVYIP